MRTFLVYLLALGALAVGLALGFPEWFHTADARPDAAPERVAPPVIAAPVVRAPIADALEALGTVRANESVEVTANRAEHVVALHFDDGQEVEAGALLAELEVDEERALLAEATALRDERRLNEQRVVELHGQGMASQRELEAATATLIAAEARVESLQATIADHEVRAPFAGVLGLRRVSVGAFVQPATVITTLDDLSLVKVDFTIPEAWLSALHPGMAVRAQSDAWPGREFDGAVATVDTRLDPRTRSATVRAHLPNPDRRLRPGMLLRMQVERGGEPVLQVPEEALIPVGDQQFVLRIGAGDVADRVPVRIGRRVVGTVEVLDGVGEGDRVVIEGIVKVRPGAPVNVVDVRADGV